jgi:hypothetical protein
MRRPLCHLRIWSEQSHSTSCASLALSASAIRARMSSRFSESPDRSPGMVGSGVIKPSRSGSFEEAPWQVIAVT